MAPPPKFFKISYKKWKKLSDDEQLEKLKTAKLKGVEIIIIDHTTGRERMINISKKFNLENFENGMDKYKKFWKSYDKMMNTVFGSNKDKTEAMWGKKKPVSIF